VTTFTNHVNVMVADVVDRENIKTDLFCHIKRVVDILHM
jgi:hypothetical protein